MLILKPNCECCDKDLAPDAPDAMICSFECTFCRTCVDEILNNVCPNCGGGFEARPVRPRTEHRPGVSLTQRPAFLVGCVEPEAEHFGMDMRTVVEHWTGAAPRQSASRKRRRGSAALSTRLRSCTMSSRRWQSERSACCGCCSAPAAPLPTR